MADLTMMLLGPSGAGKTLLATVFYRERNSQTVDKNGSRKDPLKDTWTLDLPQENLRQFSQANLSIDNTQSEEFYKATLGMYEWNFTACVKGVSSTFDVFSFKFVDYPGEWLSSADTGSSSGVVIRPEFYTYMEDSQILFGVLDGEDILKFLTNPDVTRAKAELDTLYSEILLHIGKAEVKHIIISKYDVLEQAHFSWNEVLTQLKKWDKLTDFIQRNQGDEIRIIPVSALEGKVENKGYHINKKIKGGYLKPINTNIPLALALQLAVTLESDKLKKKGRKRLAKLARFAGSNFYRLVATSGSAILNTLHGIIVGVIGPIVVSIAAFFGAVITAIVGYYTQHPWVFLGAVVLALVGLILLVRVLWQRHKEAALGKKKNIKKPGDALAMIGASLLKEVKKFDEDYPGNLLT